MSEISAIQKEPAADDVVATGIKILTSLASTLKSEEGRTSLINRLVKTDAATGQTSINIPVADKQTAKQLFDVIERLLGYIPPAGRRHSCRRQASHARMEIQIIGRL